MTTLTHEFYNTDPDDTNRILNSTKKLLGIAKSPIFIKIYHHESNKPLTIQFDRIHQPQFLNMLTQIPGTAHLYRNGEKYLTIDFTSHP